MRPRLSGITCGLLAALMLSLGCGAGETGLPHFGPDERPNVLIVLVDVLRRDHLGVYGYPLDTTPNIDAFAAEGFRFEQMYSHSTWTKPSVATLFTSVYPDQHGLGRVGFEDDGGFHTDVLPESLETMAEVFQAAGYRTGSVGANVHIQEKTGFAQGFKGFWMKRLTKGRGLNAQLQSWFDLDPETKQPFFAYLHYMDAHWPYFRRVGGKDFGNTTLKNKPPQTWQAVPAWAKQHLDEEGIAALTARYDHEIAYVDKAFGELLADLEVRGLADDTIVVFIADHGEGLYEHGFLQHSSEPYPEVTEVPLIIRLPPAYEITPGTSPAMVGLVDVMPTVLDLVGLEVPAQVQGRSLTPLMLGERLRERPVYSDGLGVRAMRSSRHTVFLGSLEPSPGSAEEASSEQVTSGQAAAMRCFDRATDPQELAPLAEPSETCIRMASALATLVRGFESQAVSGEPGGTVEFNAEEIEELKALGYLD